MDVDDADETINLCDPEHVHFMRYLMMARLVAKEELLKIYKHIFVRDPRAEHLYDVIETVNGMLKNAKLEVREVSCEITMRPCFVVFSTLYRSDRIWPSIRTEDELEFIKRVVHEILISGRGIVSSMNCLNLEIKLSKSDREDLLKTLVADKWFAETKKGILTLSALGITELEPYLRENYREVTNNCAFCKRVVYFGDLCANCNVIGHRLCIEKYKQSTKKAFKCPACSKEWVQSKKNTQMEEVDGDEDD